MKPPSADTSPTSVEHARVGAEAWFALGALGFVYLINFMDRQLFAVLQEQIRADLNLTDWQLGLIGGTMFAVFYAAMGLPIAWLADRSHRIRLISIACAVWSVFTALSGAAVGFFTMALARIGVATGEAGGVSPAYSVLADYFPAVRRGLALGLFTMGAPLGVMAGTILGAAVAEAVSWRWTFVILGLPGVLIALGLYFLVREPVRGRFDAADETAVEKPTPLDAARRVIASPTVFRMTLGAGATSFVGYGLYQWIPSFMQRSQGMTLEGLGPLLGPVFLMGVLGAAAGGWLADRLARRSITAYAYVPAVSLALAIPFLLAAIFAPSAGLTIALLIIPVGLSYAWFGPGLAAVQSLTAPNQRAMTTAIIGFFNNLIGFGLGPLVIGLLSDLFSRHYGEADGLRLAMAVGVLPYLVAALLFFDAARTMKAEYAARSKA